jgi:hypothetical protein
MNKPLTPADSDLRDFPSMMIDIDRLFGSEFHARVSDAAWRAGMTLWLKSFHQTPAGSLPNDEVALTRLAELGRDTKTWRRISAEAKRGWIECDDGRLYHRVVAEKVLEAWLEKLAQRKSSAAGNAARHGRPFDPASTDSKITASAAMLANLNPNSRALSKWSRKTSKPAPDGTAATFPPRDIQPPVGSPASPPDGSADGPPVCPQPPPDSSSDRLPSGSQGKGRERKRREEITESSSSVSAKPPARERAEDDDDLRRKLNEAANGRIASSCRNVDPIRKLLAEGVPIEAVLASFRHNIAHLRQPLQTFGAEWLAIEVRAHAAAMAESASRGDAAKAIELVFVPLDAPHWPLVESRYIRERGRKPPRYSRNSDGAKGLGWWFPASWQECYLDQPREAAE